MAITMALTAPVTATAPVDIGSRLELFPEAKYKSVTRGDDGVYALKSPDGIHHWSLMSDQPVIPKGWLTLDSQNLAFWDSTRSHYVCFLRAARRPPGGGEGYRKRLTSLLKGVFTQ